MKKLLLFMLLVTPFFFLSCSDDDNNAPNSLNGTTWEWEQNTNMFYDKTVIIFKESTFTITIHNIEKNLDGTVFDEHTETNEGTYTYKDSNVSLQWENKFGDSYSATGKVIGDLLSLTNSNGAQIVLDKMK